MGNPVHGICSPGEGILPYDRIMLESPMGSKFFNAHDDAGSMVAGMLCYRSATTQANDMTACAAEWGDIGTEGKIYVVEIPGSDIHMATNFDKTTTYSQNDPILIREIRIGDRLWLKGSTCTCVEDTTLYPANSGLVDVGSKPSEAAIEKTSHTFIALGAMTSGTWMVGEYVGITAYDDT